MTAQEAANLGACGVGNAYGFNTDKGCATLLTAAHSVWLLSPSLVIASDQEINLAYIESLQMTGQLVILKGISTFEENGNDDNIETQDDDTQTLTNEGKYKFMATFTQDMFFQTALGTIQGFGNWSTGVVDKAGTLFITKRAAGGFKGFKTGMIRRAKMNIASNTTSTKQMLEFQLLERYELDDEWAAFQKDVVGIDFRQVEPITQAEIQLVSTPEDAETTVTLRLVTARGRKNVITGVEFGQWAITKDDVPANPTAGDDSVLAGTYPLTVAALATGDELTIGLDGVIKVDGDGLYKAKAVTVTVL